MWELNVVEFYVEDNQFILLRVADVKDWEWGMSDLQRTVKPNLLSFCTVENIGSH